MSDYILIGGELYSVSDLQHHGIKGMKWGQRRWQNKDGSLKPAGRRRYNDDVYEKKAVYKQAKKDYNKSFNKAYNKSIAAYSPVKKHREANDARWDDAFKKADTLNKAKKDYKQAKKDYDNTPEAQAAKVARRKKALKVGAAVAGTALAAYGAYKLNDYVKTKHCQIQAERGFEYARERHQASIQAFLSTSHPDRDKYATSWTRTITTSGRNHAINAANKASHDSFAKAAKNVIDYKKSGYHLKYLRDVDAYRDFDDFVSVFGKR